MVANIKKVSLSISIVLSSLVLIAVFASAQAGAQEVEDNNQEPAQNEQDSEQAQSGKEYNYKAQPGDTYSQMARKAVQTYGVNNNEDLSLAQILYVETNLTIMAGSPHLNVGQEVKIKEGDVKAWVDRAKDLDEATENLWNAYVPGTDFNTDNVGE